MGILNMIITAAGTLSLIYFIICICCTGLSGSFSFVWLGVSIACFGIRYGMSYMDRNEIQVSGVIKAFLLIVVVLGIGIFGYVESLILASSNDVPKNEVDYVIILGARIDGTRVTKSLAKRLDAAYEYAKDHDNTKLIVSGGKGSGESVTEAQAMEEYLINKGFDPNRIIKEDASTNTDENIRFSREIINKDSSSVAIVTNSFHLYRAMRIAEKQGLTNVSGIAAETDKVMALNYYVREGFAVIKYKVAGQI